MKIDTENKLVIGKIIKYIRIEANMTQEKLSSKIYVSRSTLSDYEREKTDVNFEIIYKICNECEYEIIFKSKKDNKIITVNNIDRLI